MSNFSDAQLKEAFNAIDTDGSGFINGQELEKLYAQVLGDNAKAKTAAEYVFHQTDKNHDNKISFDEFLQGMKS